MMDGSGALSHERKESVNIIKRVGTVLIIVGIVDIGYMFWCIVNGVNYASSFNIFAVIGGIYLIKGNLKTVKLVAFFSNFFFYGLFPVLLLFPITLFPFDFLLVYQRLHPYRAIFELLFICFGVGLLFWISRELHKSQVLDLIDRERIPYSVWRDPKFAKIFGIGLSVILLVGVNILTRIPDAKEAVLRVRLMHGDQYKYFITSMSIRNGSVRATVTGYSESEIRAFDISWEK